jgi:cyanophycinase
MHRATFGPLLLIWIACFSLSAYAADPGTVILHGGGTVSSELRDRFVELAGGRAARLLVIPTADPDQPEDDGRLDTWRSRQPASVALLHAGSREQAAQETFAEPLQRATGVWISGGRQSTLAAIYLGTPVERELSALLQRGGVIAGTSAGAAIQSRVMLVRNNVQQGFDLVSHAIIDQHFLVRNRQLRLQQALARHPQHFGLGIDEDTAVLLRGDSLTVLGESTVTLCIPAHGSQPERREELRGGAQFNLQPLRAELAGRK